MTRPQLPDQPVWWDRDGRPTFHAHDVNDLAACRDYFGLVASIEQPNEGSHLCPECMVIVRQQPQGRPRRECADADDPTTTAAQWFCPRCHRPDREDMHTPGGSACLMSDAYLDGDFDECR